MTELDRVALEGEVVSEAPSWEDHVQAFVTVEQDITERRWLQARVAASVERYFGESSMVEFAKDTKTGKTTVYRMVQVHKLWGRDPSSRPENLYWTHFMDAVSAPNPQKAIERAAKDDLTTRQHKKAIEGDRQEAQEEDFGPAEITGTRVCPTCNGEGEVPLD